jgi:hypothetical protein
MPEIVWAREEVAFMLVEATVLNSKIRDIILSIIFITVERLRDFKQGKITETRDNDRYVVCVSIYHSEAEFMNVQFR